MTPQQFIAKWKPVTLSERAACQSHFNDLCELLGQPKPVEADPEGAWYTFERGVNKTAGGHGWADVWMRGRFGWEYKKKRRDLKAAYDQLLQYREDLENPPLLVVCDLDRFEVHTNFTGTVKHVYAFDLDGLAEPENLDVLRKVFTDPDALKPGQTPEGVTQQAAELFGQIADGMRVRAIEAPRAAHFLMKLMFCMFAEDIGLLKNKVFQKILDSGKDDPTGLTNRLGALFEAMCNGGYFGADTILHFNGGLFADAEVIELKTDEIQKLHDVARLDWENVEPSIFGTLFERTLDPDKRSQIGAHYTSREDIETLLQPVVMQPLRREWEDVQAKCEKLNAEAANVKPATKRKKYTQRDKTLRDFVERLAHVTVLDPACGSGNFLYVALHLLLDLEKEVISYAARQGVGLLPHVRPTQLAGIEINPYAQELASVVIWIGYLQWMRHNGFNPPNNPVLEPIETIRRMDAILDLSDPEHPLEPEWPEAEFIVGNPPFLGGKRLRTELGDTYVDQMFAVFADRVPRECDLVAYWFEKARHQIESSHATRAGLLATQAIRAGANRRVLERLKESGDLFFAKSDQPWVLEGADVRVSLIGFDDGSERVRSLDGQSVEKINSNLTSLCDLTAARSLQSNAHRCFMGDTKGGAFDISEATALEMLRTPSNPNGRMNSDVVRPWMNASDVTSRWRHKWIIDFGTSRSEFDAAGYETPFEYVKSNVRPARLQNKRASYRERWWIHVEPRPALRASCVGLQRILITPRVAKHRTYSWYPVEALPDSRLYVFASDSDFLYGLLHSRIHETWALATSSRHGIGNDPTYNNTTCFETFPFPEPTDAQREAIAAAARELDELRRNWLNPPEWTRTDVLEFPGSADGPWRRYIDPATVDSRGIGTVRYPRTVPLDEDCTKQLKKRTLTKLYNERPTWLDLAHRKLDEAVFAAYGWDAGIGDEELLEKLLELNLERASAAPP